LAFPPAPLLALAAALATPAAGMSCPSILTFWPGEQIDAGRDHRLPRLDTSGQHDVVADTPPTVTGTSLTALRSTSHTEVADFS
jgi:hypothetical protein